MQTFLVSKESFKSSLYANVHHLGERESDAGDNGGNSKNKY